MPNFIDKYLANGLKDFVGLQLRGSLPVRQEVLNELLADLLRQGQETDAAPMPPAAPESGANSSSLPLNPRDLLRHVKNAQVRAEEGRVILDFEVRIDD